MNSLLKSQLAGVIRFLITAAGMALVGHHVASKPEVATLVALCDPTAIAGAVIAIGSLVWGIAHKNQNNTALVVAASTGQTDATLTPKAVAAAKVAQTVILPNDSMIIGNLTDYVKSVPRPVLPGSVPPNPP